MKATLPILPVRLDDDTARLHTVVVHIPSRRDPSILGKALDNALNEEERLFHAKLERHYKPAFPAELGDPCNINIQRYSDQHTAFITLLEDHGVEILYAEPVQGCIAQTYTRDMAFVVADIVFVTRPERSDRRREIEGINHLLARCAKVARIEVGTIEGGDVIVLPQWVLVGVGEKTDIVATNALAEELKARGIDRQVVPLHLALSSVVHVDCVFNPVSPDVALVYPPALTGETLGWLRRRFDLIEATLDETTALRINTVNLDARTVVMTPGSDRLAEQLARRGLEVLITAYDEVKKGYGAFRCTTLPLRREALSQNKRRPFG